MTLKISPAQKDKSLCKQIDQIYRESLAQLPPENRMEIIKFLEKLSQSNVGKNALKVGDLAPHFCVKNAKEEEVQLSVVMQNGPVVLSFCRGGWCPFCNLELLALKDRLPEMKSLGATLIAISPQTQSKALKTCKKNDLNFEICIDKGNQIAHQFGIVFTLNKELQSLYLKLGIDIAEWNGDDSYELPIPATFVIDSMGVIKAAFVKEDYSRRMEPANIIDFLKNMQKEENKECN